MDHADGARRLADLALEPARLGAFDTDPSPESVALRAHVADCPTCRRELQQWRATWGLLATLDRDAGDRPVASDVLRAKTLAAVAAAAADAAPGRPADQSVVVLPKPRAHWQRTSWLVAAAALVVAVGAAGFGLDRAAQLERVRTETAGLGAATTAMSQVLATDVHWTTSLRTADGAADGTVAWTADQIVVIADLPSLPAGARYRCWVDQAGARTSIGSMAMTGSTGYWSAPMDGWGQLMATGAQFGVSIVSADGSSTSVLVGTL